jgi:methyl-accepting chemotaxis protein
VYPIPVEEKKLSFSSRIYTLIAGIVALVLVMIVAGGWASTRMLDTTDTAYRRGLVLADTLNEARSAQVNFQRQVQEWKNVLLRGTNQKLYDLHWKQFQEREAEMDTGLGKLKPKLSAIGGLGDVVDQVEKIRQEHSILGQRYRDSLAKFLALDWDAIQTIDLQVRGMDRPTSAGMDELVSKLQTEVQQRFDSEAQDARDEALFNLMVIAGIALTLMLLLLWFTIAALRSVHRSLGAEPEAAVEATVRISAGDLTRRLNAKTPDSLMGALEMVQSRLRNIALAIREVSFDIESRATSLPKGEAREVLRGDVDRLRSAINRLQIERGGKVKSTSS